MPLIKRYQERPAIASIQRKRKEKKTCPSHNLVKRKKEISQNRYYSVEVVAAHRSPYTVPAAGQPLNVGTQSVQNVPVKKPTPGWSSERIDQKGPKRTHIEQFVGVRSQSGRLRAQMQKVVKRRREGLGLAHGRELRADDVTGVLHVREWRVTMHELPDCRAERPHIHLERVVQTARGRYVS